MPGSILYDPPPISLDRVSAGIFVWKYDPDAETKYTLLPNVMCLGIQKHDGPDPWVARFRYRFVDPLLAPGYPRRIEHVYPLDASGLGVVTPDTRLVVRAVRDDGVSELLFDGYTKVPQADLSDDGEHVTFVAAATVEREWDTPLNGATVRDADTPDDATKNFATDLPARFNPDGKPNASPVDADAGAGATKYPVFLGPFDPANTIQGKTVRLWTLPMAARYVVAIGKGSFVDIQSYTDFDDTLQAIVPRTPGGVVDLNDATTYEYKPIEVQDVDVTGEPWPAALQRLIEPHGFTMRWILVEYGGDPVWRMEIARTDYVRDNRLKPVNLQVAGGTYDPALTNVGGMSLARDVSGIANRIAIDTAPVRYEVSVILSPGFVVDGADTGSLDDFKRSSATFAANRDKYRLWVFDECGEGHWDFSTDATVTEPGNLDGLLNPDALDPRPYVRRRRPGTDTLVSVDGQDKPLRASLSISFDYDGPEPALWDGTGTWQPVSDGSWRLLQDRLGVYLTMEDPNAWPVGQKFVIPTGLAIPAGTGKVNLVEWVVGNTANRPRLMLTCVIEGDRGMDVSAPKRPSSPTRFTIIRHVDARDRFKRTVISASSEWGVGPVTGDEEVIRDDAPEALAHAAGVQRARERATFAGTITIPRLSTAYSLGDRIERVKGRNLSLRSNAAAEAGESPSYPVVVGIAWEFDGRQSTTLTLSDRRAEPPPRRRGRDPE